MTDRDHGRDAWISRQPSARRIAEVLELGGDATPIAEEIIDDLDGRRVKCTAQEVIDVVYAHMELYGMHLLGPNVIGVYNDIFVDLDPTDVSEAREARSLGVHY